MTNKACGNCKCTSAPLPCLFSVDVIRCFFCHDVSMWLAAGMLGGSFFVGVHMALTHGVTLGMVASYIPATEVEGIGRITGTCWSFTDFVFGAPRALQLKHCLLPRSQQLDLITHNSRP